MPAVEILATKAFAMLRPTSAVACTDSALVVPMEQASHAIHVVEKLVLANAEA